MTNLPPYEEASAAVKRGEATPIHTFIYDQEPMENDNEWRRQLINALNDAVLCQTYYQEKS
jgi:hypothetical protein